MKIGLMNFELETLLSCVPVILIFDAWAAEQATEFSPPHDAGWSLDSIEEYGKEVPMDRFVKLSTTYREFIAQEIDHHLYEMEDSDG